MYEGNGVPSDLAPGNYFQFAFDLKADGRPSRVRLIATNAPANIVRATTSVFRSVRFRPLMVDGQSRSRDAQTIRVAYASASRP